MPGTRQPSPPGTPSRHETDLEAHRNTAQLKLRLPEGDAARLRLAAEVSGRSMSDYVVSLLDGRASGSAGAADEAGAALAEVSRLVSAIVTAADELRLMRGELGRTGGLVKHLFATTTTAADHRAQLDDAAHDLQHAIDKADAALTSFEAATTEIRSEAAVTARRLAALG